MQSEMNEFGRKRRVTNDFGIRAQRLTADEDDTTLCFHELGVCPAPARCGRFRGFRI